MQSAADETKPGKQFQFPSQPKNPSSLLEAALFEADNKIIYSPHSDHSAGLRSTASQLESVNGGGYGKSTDHHHHHPQHPGRLSMPPSVNYQEESNDQSCLARLGIFYYDSHVPCTIIALYGALVLSILALGYMFLVYIVFRNHDDGNSQEKEQLNNPQAKSAENYNSGERGQRIGVRKAFKSEDMS